MFENHQPKISAYGRANPENFARVLNFVIVTIRNRLFNVPADMETLERPETPDSLAAVLYGWKQDSIAQIERERESLYYQAESIVYHAESEREAAENLINLFCQIKGLGMVKAGFAAQLLYGCGGCLDSHNLERFGIKPARVKSDRLKTAKTLKTKRAVVSEYLDYCEQFGGCARLWDSWCEHLFSVDDETGRKMNGNVSPYKSAHHVSALHCESLGINPD
jgi:hypothetical protein